MDWLDDLAGYMQANGLGTVGTDIFKHGLVDEPPMQYALVLTGGLPALRTIDNIPRVDQPTVQVLSRATAQQVAAVRAMDAYTLFDDVLAQQIGANKYHRTIPQQPPQFLGYNRNDVDQFTAIFAFNLQIQVNR